MWQLFIPSSADLKFGRRKKSGKSCAGKLGKQIIKERCNNVEGENISTIVVKAILCYIIAG
jgi:hypothetical protein